MHTYFARFYHCGDTLLLNHHTVPRTWDVNSPRDIYFAPLKAVQCDANGILSLHWWPGNAALKGATQPVVLEHCQLHRLLPQDCTLQAEALQLQAAAGGVAILPVKYNIARGVILEAEITVTAADGLRCGAGLFIEGETANRGTILLGQNDG